ncbi:hypothetical protein MAM1_0242c08597 [Mucor ambiguus]|uniref:Uncharacterized protein n=1 Tax=Mucor ambiguus TaxID=91626 RepID=A0A0C9LWT3_9FUNG|nr:hypothetical protein MAM1_0242c08597 [Mucor ambiguus]
MGNDSTNENSYCENKLQHAIAYDQAKYIVVLKNTKGCHRFGFTLLVDQAPEGCYGEDLNAPCDVRLLQMCDYSKCTYSMYIVVYVSNAPPVH